MTNDSSYGVEHIYKMDELEHVRQNLGMYVGSSENPTRLLEECLDNALDEVQAGFATIVGVFIDTKNETFKILDNGRGFPFDQSLPLEQDAPVLASINLFSSGKFKKGEKDSAYLIASGLHGVGLVAVNALSDWMNIEIYRGNKFAKYLFKDATNIERSQQDFIGNPDFSTKIEVKPSKKYFDNNIVDVKIIEERLRIACAYYPSLRAVLSVDGNLRVIKGTEQELILDYLTKSNITWINLENKKGPESAVLKLAWDEEQPMTIKSLSCVNLIRVHSGVHLNRVYNIIRNVFQALAKKHGYEFDINDSLVYLRVYLNLKIIKTSFEAQVKVKLESKSDLSVMDPFETMFRKYLDSNAELRTYLLNKFQDHRKNLQKKKIKSDGKTRRATTTLTKLRDCTQPGGELLIGEGDSAVGGLIQVRDTKKHAILPLRGVIPNSLTKKGLLENNEVKEIITAIGTGTEKDCNIANLRYSKIILSADADPAGKFITDLLIILFATLTPDIIKAGKLYVCETPLWADVTNKSFTPLWSLDDVERLRAEGKTLKRYKGLGEFAPKLLKVFTLDENTRRLIRVDWSSKPERLFDLMTKSSEKRDLVMGSWKM